jgi:hypothetical protein
MVRASVLILLLSAVAAPFYAQQPFVTDDAEVTPRQEWHFEFFNEYVALSKNAAPDLRQNWSNFVIQYGLLEGLEVNVDFPILYIQRGPDSTLGSAFGLGDTDFAVKYNFLKDDPTSMRPALTLTGAVEFPTGNKSNQLGSGFTDVDFNSIVQKTFAETIVHLNFGYQISGNTLMEAIGIRTRHPLTRNLGRADSSLNPALGIDLNGARPHRLLPDREPLTSAVPTSRSIAPSTLRSSSAGTGARVGVLIGTSISLEQVTTRPLALDFGPSLGLLEGQIDCVGDRLIAGSLG